MPKELFILNWNDISDLGDHWGHFVSVC